MSECREGGTGGTTERIRGGGNKSSVLLLFLRRMSMRGSMKGKIRRKEQRLLKVWGRI